MRKVRCPRCSAITPTKGDHVKCARCGLQGRVGDAPPGPKGAPPKDPFVITIDLRKLSPTNWGRGAKALAAATILLGAFFLGGFVGVAFEKARTEINEDLEKGESLLGGASHQANSSGGSGTDPVGLNGSTTAGSTTSSSSSTNTTSSTTTTSSTSSSTTTSSTSSSTTTSSSAPPPQEPAPWDRSGTGTSERMAFTNEHPLLRITIEHWSTVQLDVKFYASSGDTVPTARVIAEQHDQQAGYRAVRYLALDAGDYEVQIKVDGDAAWEIQIEQPLPDPPEKTAGTFSHEGDEGKGPLRMEGAYAVEMDAPGVGQVEVRFFTLDGQELASCGLSGSASQNEPYQGTTDCTLDEEATVFIDVRAPHADSSWSLVVSKQ